MKAIPYEERIRSAADIPLKGQAFVMGRMEQFAETLRPVFLRPAPAGTGTGLKAVAFNMERGVCLRETADFLTACPALADADLILANELDDGNRRSGCRDTAAELAKRLNMNYVFGLEFIELADPQDPKGYHGNAVFSRWPILWARAKYLPEEYNWYFDRQRRIGGRLAVYALLEIGGRRTGAVCVHLENRVDGAGRAKQMLSALEGADRLFGRDIPVILGGDLNTNTFNGAVREEAAAMFWEQKNGASPRDVPDREPLLPLAESFGYDFRSFNDSHIPTRRKPMEGGTLDMRLDWLMARNMECLGRGTVSTLAEDCAFAPGGSALRSFKGIEISDHNAIWALCRPRRSANQSGC